MIATAIFFVFQKYTESVSLLIGQCLKTVYCDGSFGTFVFKKSDNNHQDANNIPVAYYILCATCIYAEINLKQLMP